MNRLLTAGLGFIALLAPHFALGAEGFTWRPPGELVPGSGRGSTDPTVFAPSIRFPLEKGPAFANSQVWGWGGGKKGGDQCNKENYSYPWHDNFCETRSRKTGTCPLGIGHQGQDIRPASCKPNYHWAVAVEAGTVIEIGSYTVSLLGNTGTLYRYLHMNMNRLAVAKGDHVAAGQRLGLVSNFFGGEATTWHLHFEILQNSASRGFQHVPPYMSLVRAYDRLMLSQPADQK